jgi:DNA polymerase III delta prime subunit
MKQQDTKELDIHTDIKQRLKTYIDLGKVPHLIFHGSSGSGKRTIMNWFLKQIYCGKSSAIKEYVMYVDCAHGKGIKFIREQVKFFAKTNLYISRETPFKSIVLSNADKLTTDAQSALRRLIEVFSHNTRFFVIVEDKYSMLLPILSRLGDVYVPLPLIEGNEVNLNRYVIEQVLNNQTNAENTSNTSSVNLVETLLKSKNRKIASIIKKHHGQTKNLITTVQAAEECYQNAISANDIITYLSYVLTNDEHKSKYLLMFDKMKKQYRSEPLLITTMLYNTLVVRSIDDIDNIGFM